VWFNGGRFPAKLAMCNKKAFSPLTCDLLDCLWGLLVSVRRTVNIPSAQSLSCGWSLTGRSLISDHSPARSL
jgi:hypothetical protein